jgi:site-specific DNA recombinase
MTAAIYARASTKEQVQSCDGQIRECTAKAKALGLSISDTFVDDGISGTRHDRPAYKRMLAAANGKEFDTLLLFSQSRLGRDSMETERAIRQLEFHGVRLVTCDGYDTQSMPQKIRKMTRGMKGLMDEAFLEDLREATHRGQHDSFLEGHWVGGRPYGYRLVKITDPNRRDTYGEPVRIGARLEIDPKQAAIVREIFERYSHGASPQSIAADLNARGVPSPGSVWNRKTRRCKGWARSGIWAMLRSPLYGGTYYWNRTQWTKTETARVCKRRDPSDLQGSVGNAPHLAIIRPATMKLVQLRLGLNDGKPKDKRLQMGGKAIYMLSGLLLCECGAHFVMDNATHYSCAAFRDGRACKNALRVRRDLAEQVILKPIVDELLAPKLVDEMVTEMRRYFDEKLSEAKAATAARPAAVAEMDARIVRLQDRLKNGDPDMAHDEIAAIIDKVRAKRDELLSAQPEAKRNAKVLHALPAAAKQYRDQIAKGLQGNQTEAGRARVAVRQLLGNAITLKPAKGGGHLVAHLQFHKAALLGGNLATVGFVGSGGRI